MENVAGPDAFAMPQTWDPERYIANARFVAELGMAVVDLLAPVPGERILDLGCGDGFLTAKLAAMGCRVVGVDASAAQIEAARKLGLDARVGDAENLGFGPEFDAVFSNATLHWIRKPDAAIDGVWRAWLETFAESFMKGIPPSERSGFLDEVQEDLKPVLCDAKGKWTVDYTRLRFRATKP